MITLQDFRNILACHGIHFDLDEITFEIALEAFTNPEVGLNDKKDLFVGLIPEIENKAPSSIEIAFEEALKICNNPIPENITIHNQSRKSSRPQTNRTETQNRLFLSHTSDNQITALEKDYEVENSRDMLITNFLKICRCHNIDTTHLDDHTVSYMIDCLSEAALKDELEIEEASEELCEPNEHFKGVLGSYLSSLSNEFELDTYEFIQVTTSKGSRIDPQNKEQTTCEVQTLGVDLNNHHATNDLAASNSNELDQMEVMRKDLQQIYSKVNPSIKDDVVFIKSIIPNIESAVIHYIYENKCVSNKMTTIDYLLDRTSSDELLEGFYEEILREYLKQQQDMKQKKEKEKKMKAAIFSKYGDKAIEPKYDEKGKSAQTKTSPVIMPQNEKLPKVRYREGKIVTTKGEKVIVEANPWDNYDGGSRGKVKTKGKRGKGFV